MYRYESWTVKNAERWRIDAFELLCWRRLLRVPWTARGSNQPVLKKSALNIHWKDGCWSWNSNNLATWCEELTHWKRPWCWERVKVNRRGQQRMRELDSISDFMDMNLSKLQEIMKDSEFWNTTVHEITKSRTQLSNWTATIVAGDGVRQLNLDLKDSKKIFQLHSLVTCSVLNGPLIIIFTFCCCC